MYFVIRCTVMIPITCIFMGRSGCGKGTQAKLFIDFLKSQDDRSVTYIETGDRFREFIKGNTYSSALSRTIADQGGLQPEFLAVWNWSTLLVDELRGDEHLILDGMPRRIREAHVLDSAMGFYKRDMPFVIHIKTSKAWAKEKLLLRMREDDNEEEIEKRLSWYDTEVEPIFEFYERDRNYNYIEINGEQSIEQVQKDLQSAFTELYGNNI